MPAAVDLAARSFLCSCRSQVIHVVALAVLLALFALAEPPVAGATNVSGTISTNTTWTAANSPYVMTGNVTVNAGVTLTIEPGVTVQGNLNTRSLTVNGSLSAAGTSSSPIAFTSTSDSAAGQWLGITFNSGAGTGTFKFVNVRYGGGGVGGDTSGMLKINGGTITIEDSTFSQSSVSGISINGGTSGTAASATIRRTKVEKNGFYGSPPTASSGDGLHDFNAEVVVSDSAFWSNRSDGLELAVTSAYTRPTSKISGSSFLYNGVSTTSPGYGVYIDQGSGAEGLGPDGNVAGEIANAIYDNGTFGFSGSETWRQLRVSRQVLPDASAVDWSGTYWGPVDYVPCARGSTNGHLSFGAPDPNQALPGVLQVERGPVTHKLDSDVNGGCGNDYVLVDPPAEDLPDLYFKPPAPPTFGGLLTGQTFGNKDCQCNHPQNANSVAGGSFFGPLAYIGDPVNTASGALTEFATDLRLAGPGIPFAWTRSYTSRDTTSGALGVGWTHPFAASITVVNPTTGELEYRSGSGQLTRFTRVTGGSSGAATYLGKGFDGTLTRNASNQYDVTTRDQRVFHFDSSGKLTQIKPRFLPATTLAYTGGNLTSITDSAGRTINLTYTGSLIQRVTLPDNRYVEYGYTSGRLTSVVDARGEPWTLDYDSNGRLESIEDPLDHFQLQNVVYDAQGRVTSEENGAGDTIGYAYQTTSDGNDLTTVSIPGRGDWVYTHRNNMLFEITDPLERTTAYEYDWAGHRTKVTDPRGDKRRFKFKAGNLKREHVDGLDYTILRTFNATNDLVTEEDGRHHTTTNAYASTSNADYQAGQLKTVTDRENGVTTFKYWTPTSTPTPPASNVGLLKSVTDPRGKTTLYDYDLKGNLNKVTSPLGRKTTMSYDSSGRLETRRSPRGNVPDPPSGYLSTWTYEDGDEVETFTDARDHATAYAYYPNGLLHTVTRTEDDLTDRVTTYEYENANRLWKTTDPRDGIETRLYWPDGQLKSLTSPEGNETSYDYDDAGQLTTLVEPNGNAVGGTPSDWTWTYGYDDSGNRDSESHPDGGLSTIHYDELNRPDLQTDALEHETHVGYDANSNVISRTDPLDHERTYSYDNLDRLTTETDERNKDWNYSYFPTGQLESSTTPLGNETTYTLDDAGRTVTMVDPRGNAPGRSPGDYTWQYGYDEDGNRNLVTDPLGNQLGYDHDPLGEITKITDQRGKETDFEYDSFNRLKTVTPPAAGGTGTLATSYEYDAAGNLHLRNDPNGHQTTWTYDLDHRLKVRTTEIGTWNYGYDANGNLNSLETPAGSSTGTPGDGTITYGYDHMSRQTSVDYSDTTPDVTRDYKANGLLQEMTDGSGVVDYDYFEDDRLQQATRSGGDAGLNGSFLYHYDEAGNIDQRTYPDSTVVNSTFDDDGRLETMTSGGLQTAFDYDEAGNLTLVTLPSGNGHTATRTFDRAGRLTTVENTHGSTILSKFLWTLDPAGNPTKAQTTRGTTDSYDAYEYDDRNRLTASCFDIASGASNCSGAANEITYGYDKVSNRTQETRTGTVGNTGMITSTYNAADQLTQTDDGTTTTSFTYDANGNLATKGARSYTYNLADELSSTTAPGSVVTSSYAYDGDGNRVSSSTSGGADLRYVWDPQAESGIPELALERESDGDLVRRYLNGPLGAISMTTGAGTYYLHQDPLGSITDLTDASGNPQWRYSYESYGAPLTTSNVSGTAPENRLRFNSQYLDTETGDYHLRARQYDPASGRFTAVDALENRLSEPFISAYVYANGQPTVLIDPLGLDWGPFHKPEFPHVPSLGDVTDKLAGGVERVKDTTVRGGKAAVGFAVDHPELTALAVTAIACVNPVTCTVALSANTGWALDSTARALYEGDTRGALFASLGILPVTRLGRTCPLAAEGGTVVIGRFMNRVVPYAERNGYRYYDPPRLLRRAPDRVQVWHNRRWIRSEMRNGSEVVDIGRPAGELTDGPFYGMELQEVGKYWNYRAAPEVP
jgi:RHS repeat-associated protein